jgi:3-methyladenine DNA glycosylase AlkD
MPRFSGKLSEAPIPAIQQVQKEFRTLGNPEDALFLQRFFKTGEGGYAQGDRFLGIRVPIIRKLAKAYQRLPIEECQLLLQSEWHEERLLALFLLIGHFHKGDERIQAKIYRIYLKNTASINNWDLIDTSAEHIVGAFLWDRDRAPLYPLARSKDLWKKRIAILSTFHFIRRNDFSDTLKIAEILLKDSHDLIHKAVGWLLREVGNRDLRAEEEFLKRHYRVMPRTMLRYAIEKFPEDRRKRYLKGEIK